LHGFCHGCFFGEADSDEVGHNRNGFPAPPCLLANDIDPPATFFRRRREFVPWWQPLRTEVSKRIILKRLSHRKGSPVNRSEFEFYV
jgi:hypothetical protein